MTVNLQNGSATGLAGVSRIQNVISSVYNSTLTGSSTGSILVGLGGNDTLRGGRGRNLLIGGQGRSTLRAGSDQDILIGGFTAYDTQLSGAGNAQHKIDYPALDAIMAEWGRTDETEALREQNLSNGGGLNGSWTLNTSPGSNGQPATVFDKSLPDVLIADGLDDWTL